MLTKIYVVHVTQPRPFHRWFAIHGLTLATLILSTKFEVSVSTHYEGTKSGTKRRKWGGFG